MEEIVNGIDVFREAFAPFADSFIVIGGSACRAVIPEGDIRPRKTTDIDMVLVPQELSEGFVGTFWKFIKEGGYKFASRKNKDGDKRYVFYSFVDGKEGYPDQIELLSKPDETIGTPAKHHIEYIDTGQEYSHLSAIILDRNYYEMISKNTAEMSLWLRHICPVERNTKWEKVFVRCWMNSFQPWTMPL